MTSSYNIAVLLIPLVGSLAVLLFGRKQIAVARVLSVVTAAVVFVISWRIAAMVSGAELVHFGLSNTRHPFGLELVVDRVGALLLLVFSGISLVVMVFAQRLLEKEISEKNVSHYYAVYFLLLTALLAVTMSNDIFNMYIFLEVVTVSAALLVAAKGDKLAIDAALKYLLLNMLGSGVLLMGIAGMFMGTGHLNLTEIAQALPNAVQHFSLDILASVALIVVGVAVKSALFPLHSWLPDAHGSAATPSSVVISGLLVKVNIVFLLKLLTQVLPINFISEIPLQPTLLVMATMAILGGSLMALRQTDIKRMLAYSTVAQVGYIYLGLGLMVEESLVGAVFHILNHAVVKGMLVLAAGSIMKLTGRRKIADFAGVGRRFPLPMVVFTIGALSMVGIPPLSGFVSKWYLGLGALALGRPIFVLVLLASSLLNALYYLPIVISAFFRSGVEIEQHMELPVGAKISLIVLAIACVLLGLFSNVPINYIQPAIQQLFLGGGA